jgi:Domain of unknown function (DUF4249)
MPHNRLILLLLLMAPMFWWGCGSFEKEVDLKIPPHERKLVVECYLEPGKPYRMVLTESVGFFDGPDTPFVSQALVVITHNGVSDTLPNVFSLDFTDFKVYNYSSTKIVPADYNSEFSLYVRDEQGREARASTRILPPVDIASFTYEFDEDSLAGITVKWPDQVGERNYYYFTFHRDSLVTQENNDFGLIFDFTLDDRIGDGEEFTISSFNFLEKDDLAIATVYPITEDYWRYLETTNASVDANGNPFANPVSIFSKIEGGYGVFTGLSYVRDTVLIE